MAEPSQYEVTHAHIDTVNVLKFFCRILPFLIFNTKFEEGGQGKASKAWQHSQSASHPAEAVQRRALKWNGRAIPSII